MQRQASGHHAEQLALTHLRNAGLQLITQNFSCRTGEIDLIMRDRSAVQGNILVFVEVRFRADSSYGGAAASVTPTKRQRLIRTARRFLQLHKRYANWPCRFDVVALSGAPTQPGITWIPGAFEL